MLYDYTSHKLRRQFLDDWGVRVETYTEKIQPVGDILEATVAALLIERYEAGDIDIVWCDGEAHYFLKEDANEDRRSDKN